MAASHIPSAIPQESKDAPMTKAGEETTVGQTDLTTVATSTTPRNIPDRATGMITRPGALNAITTCTSRQCGTNLTSKVSAVHINRINVCAFNKDFILPSIDSSCVVIESLNCHGMKHSWPYISDRFQHCDILCLTETWLKPGEEITAINAALQQSANPPPNLNIFSVSGMRKTDAEYTGRPYGGVAIICKQSANFTYRELNSEFDNIRDVGIYDNSGKLVQVLINVYMPYYDKGNQDQTDKFMSAIDALQTILDA